MIIGDRLRELREEKKFSQGEIEKQDFHGPFTATPNVASLLSSMTIALNCGCTLATKSGKAGWSCTSSAIKTPPGRKYGQTVSNSHVMFERVCKLSWMNKSTVRTRARRPGKYFLVTPLSRCHLIYNSCGTKSPTLWSGKGHRGGRSMLHSLPL